MTCSRCSFLIRAWIYASLFYQVLVSAESASTGIPSGQPTGIPSQSPTDYLHTEIEYVASLWVSGLDTSLQFKADYRTLFEKAVSESFNPPIGRIIGTQTLVQVVTVISSDRLVSRLLASSNTFNVFFQVTLIMERYNYGTVNRTFEMMSQDLSEAVTSGDLQQRLNASIAVTYSNTVPGVTITNFRALYADMTIHYLRSNWPTSMPTIQPESDPRKKHSVAYSIGAIVIGGAFVSLWTIWLDARAKRASSARVNPSVGPSAADVAIARNVIRSAIPFMLVPASANGRIERMHPMSFQEAAAVPFRLFYLMVAGLFNCHIWKHHRWIGSLTHQTYIPRYVRVFTVVSFSALMLLFSLFWIRDIWEGYLPKGFRVLTWDFIDALIVSMCAVALVSSCVYTIVEGWYYTIMASYTRVVVDKKDKRKGAPNSETENQGPSSPSGRRRAAAIDPSQSAPSVTEVRQPISSPPPNSNSSTKSRRISVRSATMGTSAQVGSPALSASVNKGSVSGPLNVIVSRRNNIRPRNSDDSGLTDSPRKGPTGFAPVPTRFTNFSVPVSRSGVHNVSRLQEEIMYCRGTLIAGEAPKSKSRDRTASSAGKTMNAKGLRRCHQFDRIWGVNNYGLISENRPTRTFINAVFGRTRSSFQLIVSDLFSVHRAAGIELRKMQRPSMRFDPVFNEHLHQMRNRHRMVQLFHLDVLPPLDRAIVYNQIARHERLTEPVTVDRRVKIVGLIQIVVCFFAAIFCVYWFSRPVSEIRQTSVVIVFLFWLGLDVLVVSTLSTVIKHVIIPHIAIEEVQRVTSWLLKTLDQLFGSISAGIGQDENETYRAEVNASASNRQKEMFKMMQSNIAGDINTSNMPSFVSLNAAHHFFLSSRIAGLFPISFPEVKAIYSFHTLWPKRNMDILYNAEVEAKQKLSSMKEIEGVRLNVVHIDGSSNINAMDAKPEVEQVTPPAQWMWYPKLLPYLLIYYFMGLPLRVQDIFIDILSWGITLGALYLHTWLYFVNPYFPLIPIPSFMMVCSVCFMLGVFRDAKLANYPRLSKDVGLWIMENKESDDPVGLETLYVHDALKEQKKNKEEMMDIDANGKPKSDFLAAIAAARDLDEEEDSDEEGKKGITAAEAVTALKERMVRSLEAEIQSRAQARRADTGSLPHGQGNKIVLEALRPAPIIIKSPT